MNFCTLLLAPVFVKSNYAKLVTETYRNFKNVQAFREEKLNQTINKQKLIIVDSFEDSRNNVGLFLLLFERKVRKLRVEEDSNLTETNNADNA